MLFLHGGPGGHTSKASTIFFDPAVYRVVLFDQRGAGRSLPNAELEENTSQHLVADIEVLRTRFSIEKWHVVFGGSWGSTLALLYTQTHPERARCLVLRGVFTVRKQELDFTNGPIGPASLFPEAYEKFVGHVPEADRHGDRFFQKYYDLLRDEDRSVRVAAATEWNRWELSIGSVVPPDDAYALLENEDWTLAHARLESHYFMNGAFLEEGQLLKEENLKRIEHIPSECTLLNQFPRRWSPTKRIGDRNRVSRWFTRDGLVAADRQQRA